MKTPEHVHEKFLVSALLTEGAGKSSAALDSFASWLLGAFGAALALIIGNLQDLQPYLKVASIRSAGGLFVVAAVVTVFEKYIAAILGAARKASAAGRDLGGQLAGVELDFSVVFSEVKKATFPPISWFLDRSFAKAESGDLAASARNVARWAQVQGFLVLIQVVLLFRAAVVVFQGLVG